MSLPAFRLLRPGKVEQAVELLAKHAANIQVLAGGTDLIPSLRQKLFEPKYVLDIRGLGELRGIRRQPAVGHRPHQRNAPTRAAGLMLRRLVRGTRRQTHPAMDTLLQH